MTKGSDLACYRLLASALAGRPVELARHRERHDRSFSDGSVILVPEARAKDDAWCEIAVQACLIAGGAFAAPLMRKLYGRASLAQRYLCLEATRCVRLRAVLAPDALLSLAAFREQLAISDGAESSWRIALSPRALPPSPPLFGVLLPGRVLREQRVKGRASEASAAAPQRIRNFARVDPEQSEQSKILAAFQQPFARAASLVSELLDQIFERAASGAGSGTTDAPSEGSMESGGLPFSTPRAARSGAATRALQDSTLFSYGVSHRYPEWDEGGQRYRHDFTHVAEVDPPADARIQNVLPRKRAEARKLRRQMARLCLEYEPRRHQLDGDDLMLDALVRLWTNVRAGHAGDERIYMRSLRTRRDLGVLVLLDMTGSSGEPGASGLPVFQTQARLAQQLVEALYESGERVALYGFHSWGRTLVRLQRIKAFEDRLDSGARARFARVWPVGYSRLGAAIRHGDHMLRTRAGTSHRLLLLISDAIAYDQGYESRYARADTRRALAEARALGTACLCLNVAGDVDDRALSETFGRAYLRISGEERWQRPVVHAIERSVHEVERRKYGE